MAADQDWAVKITGVTKRFGPTTALDDVNVTIARGDSVALLGRNGAGKSTLIAALTGLLTADSGDIQLRPVPDAEPLGPGGEGLACVYQKSSLLPDLTVGENIWLRQFPRTRLGMIDWREVRTRAVALLQEWGAAHLVDRTVDTLEPIERKVVEICRALAEGPQILLLDEPTAGLDEAGAQELFAKISRARERGVTIVYVSHYLEEVFEVCNRAVILRDGRVVREAPLAELSVEAIVDAMVGPEAAATSREQLSPHVLATDAPTLLELDSLDIVDVLTDASLKVRAGEIVGLSGLDGAGHVALAEAVVGLEEISRGRISVNGRQLPLRNSPGAALRAGVGLVPEDRHISGYVPDLSVEENSTMSALGRLLNRLGLIRADRQLAMYRHLEREWEIKASAPTQPTSELSGGNQQKVVMARALAADPSILVLINPTAGVDVAARGSIYRTILDLAANGRAVLIASSDDVDFQIAHRVVVFFKGRHHRELASGYSERELAASVQGQ